MDRCKVLRNPEDPKFWSCIVKNSTKEGWFNAMTDYQFFLDAFPNNFVLFVAVDAETEELMGSVSVATYQSKSEPLSMIGMYIVPQEHRGKGIGSALWELAMKEAKPRKFLYGAENMHLKYKEKFGFDKIADWHVLTCRMPIPKVFPLKLNHDPTLIPKRPEEVGWERIAKFYKRFCPQVDGSQVIKAILSVPGAFTTITMTTEDVIVGLCRVRETDGKTLTIGPLLGNDTIAACTALREVLFRLPELRFYKTLHIQWPSTNTEVPSFLSQMCNNEGVDIEKHINYAQWTNEIFELPVQYIYALSQNDVVIV